MMAASKKSAERNPGPSAPTNLEATKISTRLDWCVFCTGGLLTTGGLGWSLRLAYAEEPKAAMLSYLAGSAGACLFNMAVYPQPGKKASVSKWFMMVSGALLSGTGFGYCAGYAVKENAKSAIIACTIGSLGYIMANAAVYTMYRKYEEKKRIEKEEEEKKYRYLYSSGEELFDAIYPPHARIDYPTRSCDICKAYVEKAILERKEAEKRQGLKSICYCLWNNVKKICPFTGSVKDPNSLVGKKTSRDNLKRETLKTRRHENKRKETSNKLSPPLPTKDLIRDPAKVCLPRYGSIIPKTGLNKFPGEKSTQTKSELGIKGTQTEESFKVRSKEFSKEVLETKEQLTEEFALANEDVCPCDLSPLIQQILESSTEDQHSSNSGISNE